MELKELLQIAFKVIPKGNGISGDQMLTYSQLKRLLPELQKTDEFKDSKIHLMTHPISEINNKTLTAKTMKLGGDVKFEGDVYIFSIETTPEMYAPRYPKISEYKGKSGIILPITYDPETFTPWKQLILKWSPEQAQDIAAMIGYNNEEYDFRKYMHTELDKVLDDLGGHEMPSVRGIMIRGVFPSTTNGDGKTSMTIES